MARGMGMNEQSKVAWRRHPNDLLQLHDNGLISRDVEPHKQFQWQNIESEDWFKKIKELIGEDWYYYNSDITLSYQYDDLGFRNHELVWKNQDDYRNTTHRPYGLVTGSSITEGSGMFLNDLWWRKFRHTKIYNTALAGIDTTIIAYNLGAFLRMFPKPEFVIVSLPITTYNYSLRSPANGTGGLVRNLGPWVKALDTNPAYGHFLDGRRDIEADKWSNAIAIENIKNICRSYGISLYWVDHNSTVNENIHPDSPLYGAISYTDKVICKPNPYHWDADNNMEQVYKRLTQGEPWKEFKKPHARDGMHPGADWHLELANEIREKWLIE